MLSITKAALFNLRTPKYGRFLGPTTPSKKMSAGAQDGAPGSGALFYGMAVTFVTGATGVALTDPYKAEIGKFVSKVFADDEGSGTSITTARAEGQIIEVVEKILHNSIQRVDAKSKAIACPCKKGAAPGVGVGGVGSVNGGGQGSVE